jgi:sarcosine oxidase subunit beta
MATHAAGFDVAVIGGGVIGLSVAREAARRTNGGVVLLERLPAVGHGSSSRANGGVRAQFMTAPNIAFSMYSIEEFERLRDAHGDVLGFRQAGYLLFTGNERRLAALRTGFDLQRSMGVATQWLSAAEVVRRAPFVRPDGLLGGTFHARDGFIDPHGAVTVMGQEGRALGVEVRTNADVLAVAGSGAGFEVTTSTGTVRAAWVVNAAGADARSVAAMVGVDIPVEPIRRNLAFFQALPGAAIPMCVDMDTGVLVRRDGRGGYVVAYSDPSDPPSRETSVDPAFLPALAARIGNRFPFLEEAAADANRCWAGLYPETPDHHAIVGVSSEAPRFVQCVGFGGHGIMHAPAAGRAVAELIADGVCSTFDLHPLRPSRFAEGDLVMEAAVF